MKELNYFSNLRILALNTWEVISLKDAIVYFRVKKSIKAISEFYYGVSGIFLDC